MVFWEIFTGVFLSKKNALKFEIQGVCHFHVDSTGLRSNFTKDLQAIESAEHFINLALERLEINSLDELENTIKKSHNSNCRKSKK